MGRGCQTGILDWWGRRGPHVLHSRGSKGLMGRRWGEFELLHCQPTTQVTRTYDGWRTSAPTHLLAGIVS